METIKQVSLVEAREELEQRGFKCSILIEKQEKDEKDDDDEQPSSRERQGMILVGILTECSWALQTKKDTIAFVNELPAGERLSLQRIEEDLEQSKDTVLDLYDGGCPPYGVKRGRSIIYVYLCNCNPTTDNPESHSEEEQGRHPEESSIDQDALQRILAEPAKEWCNITFLAAQDKPFHKSHFFDSNDTPFWGKWTYAPLQYWASLLTGRPIATDTPPASYPKWFLYLSTGNQVLLLCIILVFSFSDPWLALVPLCGLVFDMILVVIQWCRMRCLIRNRRRQRQRATTSFDDVEMSNTEEPHYVV